MIPKTKILALACLAGFLFSGCTRKEKRAPYAPDLTVTDIDGHVYRTVKIGNQVWTAENLKVTRYANGDPVPYVTDRLEWENRTDGAFCHYNHDAGNDSTYGCLYNWYALNDGRKLAPKGWHTPTDAEWQALVDHLGSDAAAGAKMKEAGTARWLSPNMGADNESGFTALPGGYRDFNGSFLKMGCYADFWSSTEYDASLAWFRGLGHDYASVFHYFSNKQVGFSVRLLKD